MKEIDTTSFVDVSLLFFYGQISSPLSKILLFFMGKSMSISMQQIMFGKPSSVHYSEISYKFHLE